MKWKLWTINETVRPSSPEAQEYDSEHQALSRACEIIRQHIHVKVLYIEKPDSSRFELDAIKRWCDAQPRTS